MRRIVLMGPPGVGKGTQGALLAAELSVPHITTGELLRKEVERGTLLGLDVADALSSGNYVDDAVMTTLLRNRLDHVDTAAGFVLDGYPRTSAQVEVLDRLLETHSTAVDTVILLHAEDPVLLARLAGREGDRPDDAPEIARERLLLYKTATTPVVRMYEARGLLRRIDGAWPVELVAEAVTANARADRRVNTSASPLAERSGATASF